ncbi:MAG: ASKHA domain-containing protein [Syntrophobacteraceae bacterium]|nr:ASKHA domain-containing protein [Syntrophobacteraceae bacterium]
MSSIKVTFQPSNQTVMAERGETIFEAASRGNVDIDNLCGGQGVCGRCRVRVLRGKVERSSQSLGFLDKKDLDEGFAIACRTQIEEEDLEVLVPPQSTTEQEQILTADRVLRYESPQVLEGDAEPPAGAPHYLPLVKKFYLELPEPTLADNLSDLERIFRELNKKMGDTRAFADFSCLHGLAASLRQNRWKVTAAVHLANMACPVIRTLEAGNTAMRNFGVAVDVGTTTIVAQLVDLRTSAVMGVEGSHNVQARYGEDVISRMIFACGRGGLKPLNDAVVGTINSLIDSLTQKAGITSDEIYCLVAAGNTTMTHLLLALEPCAIRVEPYVPTATRFPRVSAATVGLHANPKAVLHCVPCVSSYVGGDIAAGVLASGMNDQPRLSALIDIGTNGEIVVGNSEWLVCCSASAGPAFEGGGAKCGMRAVRGAIESVRIDGPKVLYSTIGQARPRGVCGSGLIDVISEMVQAAIIDQSGKFIDFDHPAVRVVDDTVEFVISPGSLTETGEPVSVTEDDIGNLIKSKAAILAAMKVLLGGLGMSFSDLEQIYVAGGFGAHLDIEKAIIIGLLPDIPKERIQFIGNSSLAGARLALLSVHAFRKLEAIARQMTYLELSVKPEFMEEFVAALFLPHTQMELFPTVREKLAHSRPSA